MVMAISKTNVNLSSKVMWHSPEINFTTSAHEFNQWYVFRAYTFKIASTSPMGQWVNNNYALPIAIVKFQSSKESFHLYRKRGFDMHKTCNKNVNSSVLEILDPFFICYLWHAILTCSQSSCLGALSPLLLMLERLCEGNLYQFGGVGAISLTLKLFCTRRLYAR